MILNDVVLLNDYSKKRYDYTYGNISEEDYKEALDRINRLPSDVIEGINKCIIMDRKYRRRAVRPDVSKGNLIFSFKYFKDVSWNGFWMKATGIDVELFIEWLTFFVMTGNKEIEQEYLKVNKNEKYIPFSIKKVQEIAIKNI